MTSAAIPDVTSEPAPGQPPRRPRRAGLLPVQALYLLFLPAWLPLSFAATMAFAAAGGWWAAPALLAVWVYPVVAAVAVLASHVVWSRSPRTAHRVNLLAVPWLVVGTAALVWILTAG